MSKDGLHSDREGSFTPEERKRLREMADQEGITVPELLRKIVTEALEKLPEGGNETEDID